jgi:uncharacterized protein (TIGR02246 family)
MTSCRPAGSPHRTEDLAAIRALDEAYVEAVIALDWEGLAALFKTDGVLMPPNEATVTGRAALRERGENFNIAAVKYTHTEIDVGGASGVAYLHGTYAIELTFEDDTATYEDVGKYLWILERQPDGEWLIEKVMWNSDMPLPLVAG